MKYIKEYHRYSDSLKRPKIGDYIIVDADDFTDVTNKNFISSHIGQLVSITDNEYSHTVKYQTNDENDLIGYTTFTENGISYVVVDFTEDEIKYWSSDKGELESVLDGTWSSSIWSDTEKYNI